ncbi:MAG TPA: DnaD domain protein [Clostridiales bacterium]|nr:DnaD domain protein [Clostridiales bacterium]
MNNISLNVDSNLDITIIPNIFIDKYMITANGEYIKVYLYLLRCYQCNKTEVTVNSIADHLDNTENDVLRALFYWEKFNLLTITRDDFDKISSISFSIIDESSEPIATLPKATMPKKKQALSKDKILEISNDENLKYTLTIIEVYLNRPLKQVDIQLVYYLYDELNFSSELIMYLYEYCISKNKKSISYIEAVALNWSKAGIDTEEKAQALNNIYNEQFNIVSKAFGLNRTPGQLEQNFIIKWFSVYKFSDELVTEACNRSLIRTSKPDFNYANRILEIWHKKGATTLQDVKALDNDFKKDKLNKVPLNKNQTNKNITYNKFNQFPQRNYSEKDYATMEQKLLNKGM